MKSFALCLALLGVCSALPTAPFVGGKVPITDEKKLSVLTGKVSNYLQKINTRDGTQLEFIRSHSATVKIVAGVFYEMFAEINENSHPVECKITLWEKSWMNFVSMRVECGKEKRVYSYESVKQQTEVLGGNLGGYRKMSEQELEELKPKLSAVFDELRATKDGFDYIMNAIMQGKRQVVAGMHYIVTVRAVKPRVDCLFKCEADIFQNLKGKFERVDIKCGDDSFHYPARAESTITGGKVEITEEKRLSDLSQKVSTYMEKINEEQGAHLGLIRIKSATVQVVAGPLYEMTAETNENSRPTECKITLWEKPWMNFVHMKVECGTEKRVYTYESDKQQVEVLEGNLGGYRKMSEQELEALKPKLSAVFDELRATKDGFDYIMNAIMQGKRQVVAGMHYIVTVRAVKPNVNCLFKCEADISQNLKGKLERVDIKCGDDSFHYPALTAFGMTGGKLKITDEKRLAGLSQKVSTYVEKINTKEGTHLELLRIKSATVQVVAGALYVMSAEVKENSRPTECKISLLEKPWMNFVSMKVECGAEKRVYTYESEQQAEAFGAIVGGFKDMSEKELKELEPKLSAVFDELRENSDDFTYNMNKIIKGKRQVVAGMHYIVTVQAFKSDDKSSQECEADIFEDLKGKFDSVNIRCGTQLFPYINWKPVTEESLWNDLAKRTDSYLNQIQRSISHPRLVFNCFKSASLKVVSKTATFYEMFAKVNENGKMADCKIVLLKNTLRMFVRMDVECGSGKNVRHYAFESSSVKAFNDVSQQIKIKC